MRRPARDLARGRIIALLANGLMLSLLLASGGLRAAASSRAKAGLKPRGGTVPVGGTSYLPLLNERVITAVIAAGYEGALAAWGGGLWTPEARWREPRAPIGGALTLSEFAKLVEANTAP